MLCLHFLNDVDFVGLSCFVFLVMNKEHIGRKVKTAFTEEGCSVSTGTAICTGTESLCTQRCMHAEQKVESPFHRLRAVLVLVSARAHLRSFLEEKPLQGFRELAEGRRYP